MAESAAQSMPESFGSLKFRKNGAKLFTTMILNSDSVGTKQLDLANLIEDDGYRVLLSKPNIELDRALIMAGFLAKSGQYGLFDPNTFLSLVGDWLESSPLDISVGRAMKPQLNPDGSIELRVIDANARLYGDIDAHLSLAHQIQDSL